ncbi:MAG: AAA family ATPase [Proteobacteria bacterium]|nr:AAA family ATPase [Pseudomonadota bacterium]
MLKALEIHGLRGFSTSQTLALAVPHGNAQGSGLTVIVGANNAGKSTVIEALRAIAQREDPSLSQGRRNLMAGDQIRIKAVGADNRELVLASVRPGSSETQRTGANITDLGNLLLLPSRRVFGHNFGKSESDRATYMHQMGFPATRVPVVDQFAYRLFKVAKNRAAFDEVMKQVMDPVLDWTIDQADSGQYFLKIARGTTTHTSEGLGEGLISLLYIVDALYDSNPGDTIGIDEPELSLHPALQRKLAALFLNYARDRQLIVSTHSPHFVSLHALPNGTAIARVYVKNGGSCIAQISSDSSRDLAALLRNQNNPHILGLLAREVFFLEDQVILVEGQEDVVFFDVVQRTLQPLLGSFFGWGVGGADNMPLVAQILHELGYGKVIGILDANKGGVALALSKRFPEYRFYTLPSDDIRSKRAVPSRPEVQGLLTDANDAVRAEYREDVQGILAQANEYFRA